jgi:hypothetical protein
MLFLSVLVLICSALAIVSMILMKAADAYINRKAVPKHNRMYQGEL